VHDHRPLPVVARLSELQHPKARGFELVADVYERARPSYPAQTVAWLAQRLDLGPGRTVLDLGAGTGKLTRSLVETGARVLALEPGDEMRARLMAAVPEAEPVAAGAEAIPLGDGSVHAATAAAAFHWFRLDEALPEIHRVLRPGGGLALVWNERDPDDPFQRKLTELLRPLTSVGRRRIRDRRWMEPVEASGLFGPLEEHTTGFADDLDGTGLVERVRTISFVALAGEPERERLEAELRGLAEAAGGVVRFAYRTQAFVTFSAG
jgi:ubiquinone/menaquinone biosynthesis C-methylase UbiE